MAQNNDRPNNLVLVDYKNTTVTGTQTSGTDALADTSGTMRQRGLPGGSHETGADGNGRIRKMLVLGVVAIAGTIFFNTFFSEAPDSHQTASHTEGTLEQQQPEAIQESSSHSTQAIAPDTQVAIATPNFIFNSHNEAIQADLPTQGDVPLVEVDSIDDAVPVALDIDGQSGNPAPLVVATPELANDYTREPSQILLKIVKGDTLSGVLAEQGLSQQEIGSIVTLPEVEKFLVNLRPGQEIEVNLDATRRLTAIRRAIDLEKTLFVERQPDNIFSARVDLNPLEKNLQLAEVELKSSLYLDGAQANLTEAMIMDLHSIFQWSVDFKRDVRAGDQLSVLYEAYYKDGKKVMDGNILAAEYQSAAEIHKAYRHSIGDKASYYDSSGQSLQKRFLRNPIKARITSKYNLKRKHPIRHTIRAHRGVDYGARTGTPVHSVGDGQVIFAGVKGSYGNTVEIQHGKRYTTLYAHLSKFPEKMKKGSRVSQGDVIGFVGSTGLATGPHLHYEFRVDGKHHDPQKVKLPGGNPLVDADLLAFKESIRSLDARFASLRSESDTLAMR